MEGAGNVFFRPGVLDRDQKFKSCVSLGGPGGSLHGSPQSFGEGVPPTLVRTGSHVLAQHLSASCRRRCDEGTGGQCHCGQGGAYDARAAWSHGK